MAIIGRGPGYNLQILALLHSRSASLHMGTKAQNGKVNSHAMGHATLLGDITQENGNRQRDGNSSREHGKN